MPFDPVDLMTGNDPGKGAKPSSGFDPSDVKAAAGEDTASSNLIAGTIDPTTTFSDFRFQPKTNADNYRLRAQDQGFWESLGITAANLVPDIANDIVQGIGYLGTLMEFGSDRDYSNAITEELEKFKKPFGEVYLENPGQVTDFTDSAWWFNNLGGLVESAASFAVEGAGIAKLFGTLARTAAWSARSARLASKAAQGLSAATLSYMEGAMSGARVFETAYNKQYMKMIGEGIDPAEADERARQIASDAAATTVQLHTIMNTGLNMTALTPLFRDPEQSIVRWWKTQGARQPGETADAWIARINAAVPEGSLKKILGLGQGRGRLAVEAVQEGLEEVNTQYAERVGAEVGEGKSAKDVAGKLFEIDRYFREVLDEEGALNFALGALGGVAQTAILDNIPVHKVIKYGPDGKPLRTKEGALQTERISSHTMNSRMNREYFDNIKDALTKDIQWFADKNKELEAALKNKDLAALARTRADMMSVHNLRAVSMGLGSVWRTQYEDIAALDNTTPLAQQLDQPIRELTRQMEDAFNSGDVDLANKLNAERMQLLDRQSQLQDVTEAMQKGYAQDRSDNAYRDRAMQAIRNLEYLEDLYGKMKDKFSAPEYAESGIADHMFYRHANLYLHKQQLDQMETDLMKLKDRIDKMTLTSQDDLLVKQAQEYLQDKEVLENTVKKLNNDIKRLNEAVARQNDAVFLKILDKYRIPATKDAASRLTGLIEARKNELQKRIDKTNQDFKEAIDLWQADNTDRKPSDVLQQASQRPVLEDLYRQNKAYLQQGLTEYDIAREQLARDSKDSAIREFIRENKPRNLKDEMDKQHVQAYEQQIDREVAADLDVKQKEELLARTKQRISDVQKELNEAHVQLAELRRQRRNMTGFFKNRTQRRENTSAQENLQARIAELNFELAQLQGRRGALTQQAARAAAEAQDVSRTPPPPVQPEQQQQQQQTAQQPEITQQQQLPAEEEYAEMLPWDFTQEVIPEFTTIEEGNPVLDNLVGGNESGTAVRQFVQMKKDSTPEWLTDSILTMIKKHNLPVPTEEEVNRFLKPYITALRNVFLNQVQSPEQAYEDIKSFLKPDVLTVLDILEGEFREHGFSYDRAMQVLNKQVQDGNIPKNLAGLVANRMRDYLETVEEPVAQQEVTVEEAAQPEERPMNEQPETYIPPVADTEPTEYSNATLELDNVHREEKMFVGAQNIDVVKANYNTHPYREFDTGTEIRIQADYKELDPNLNQDVLLPGAINAGDEVELVVDEEWAGEINYDTEMIQDEFGEQIRKADMFQNYLDNTGKIPMNSSAMHPKGAHANVPIKIVHQRTGKTVGYFPRADWVLAKYPDTANYRNVTDEYNDGDVVVTENVRRQYERVMKVREAVIRSWNTSKELKLKTKISQRGPGHIMLNREINVNTGRTRLLTRSAKNMLPGKLEIAIMKKGSAYVGSGVLSQKKIRNMPSYMKSATSLPVVLLPAPDGSYVPSPLYTHRLGDNPGTLNTIVGAIEMYLLGEVTKATDRIKTETGFDILTAEGLRDFIQQYFTYTQKFKERDTVITPSEAGTGAIPQFMLDIPDVMPGEKFSAIKIGMSFSGEKPMYARLVNGSLDPDFEQMLRDGLQGRFKNVIFAGNNLRGVNSRGEFKAPTIRKDGTVQINTYADYNEFIKANATTFVYGLNKHKESGEHVYMANSTMQLDYHLLLQNSVPATATTIPQQQQQVEQQPGQVIDEEDELADLFGNGSLSPTPSPIAPVPTPEKGEPISLEFLRELRNFTPEAHRNSKTPEQVLEELLKRGITVLADGHNPFYTC